MPEYEYGESYESDEGYYIPSLDLSSVVKSVKIQSPVGFFNQLRGIRIVHGHINSLSPKVGYHVE